MALLGGDFDDPPEALRLWPRLGHFCGQAGTFWPVSSDPRPTSLRLSTYNGGSGGATFSKRCSTLQTECCLELQLLSLHMEPELLHEITFQRVPERVLETWPLAGTCGRALATSVIGDGPTFVSGTFSRRLAVRCLFFVLGELLSAEYLYACGSCSTSAAWSRL